MYINYETYEINYNLQNLFKIEGDEIGFIKYDDKMTREQLNESINNPVYTFVFAE